MSKNQTATIDPKVALEKVLTSKPDMEIRVTRNIPIGNGIHQGDVYLWRVEDSHPRGKARGTTQVAVGDTVGSRHVVEGKNVKVFEGKTLPKACQFTQERVKSAILGPVVVATEEFTLTHPEHAHHCLPAGTYQVTYQLDRLTMRAVQD